MLSTLLSVGWSPEIRGIVVVVIFVVALMGSTYLLLGTNLGARLGFLIAITALSGWFMCMGFVWAIYGIGLKGAMPSWKPANPITIVRDGALLDKAGVVKTPIATTGLDATATAQKVQDTMKSEGWSLLDEADPRRGQAVASADAILQNEAKEFAAGDYVAVNVYDRGGERGPKLGKSIDFIAFFHKPHYSVVEIAPVIPQRSEPGRAPAKPVINTAAPHRYVVMIRDLGNRRRPALLTMFGGGIIFFLLAWLLHRRERFLNENLALKPAEA